MLQLGHLLRSQISNIKNKLLNKRKDCVQKGLEIKYIIVDVIQRMYGRKYKILDWSHHCKSIQEVNQILYDTR